MRFRIGQDNVNRSWMAITKENEKRNCPNQERPQSLEATYAHALTPEAMTTGLLP